MLTDLKALNREQRAACLASFLGWTLDAFDFFLLVFVVKAIADEFHTAITEVTFAILLTLAMRPLGASRCEPECAYATDLLVILGCLLRCERVN